MSKGKDKVTVEDGVTSVSTVIDNGEFGTRTIRFETGKLAQQAAGAVEVYLDTDTMLLATTAYGKQPKESFDFFPLTVDVEERMYAVGKIPGSFFRREGRPTTEAILTSRLIDRPLRPLFVEGLRNEVQVVITVLSLDLQELYDVIAINGASAATQISGLPFSGPVGGVRVALVPTEKNKQGKWIAFPSVEQLESAVFDMVVAGRVVKDTAGKEDVAITMVEAEATDKVISLVADGAEAPTETVVAAGLEAAKPVIAQLCKAQLLLAEKAAKKTEEFVLFPPYSEEIYEAVASSAQDKLLALLKIVEAEERDVQLDQLKLTVLDELEAKFPEKETEIAAAFRALLKKSIRNKILTDKFRVDGRGVKDIRRLSAEVDIVPRAHGSALFQRGKTQILGVTTLDMLSMSQQIDSLVLETSRRYMHHYNFPPYSTGEPGRVGSPKRREIGHGALAQRALIPVLPSTDDFPYAIRQVSEALSSDGSTSMGSVCASTLALLNAGVPLKAPVAGIAMGLVSGEVKGKMEYVTLTDILGSEDAFGDMDFKVAGTKDFITALQLDTKLEGIPSEVLAAALLQAKEARLTILDVIAAVITKPDKLSEYAPRIETIKIPVEKIGELIGPKGKTINGIAEDTGAILSVEDDGTVYISSTEAKGVESALQKVDEIINPRIPQVGEVFEGAVVKTTNFGAFISLLPGSDGLLHISKLGNGKRISRVEDVVKVGDLIKVEVLEIDDRGKISLGQVAKDN